MGNQAEFNEKINQANEALTTLGENVAAIGPAIEAEGQQIRDFIEANPDVDTSALDGVVANLQTVAGQSAGLATAIGEIFTAPETEGGEGEGGEVPA